MRWPANESRPAGIPPILTIIGLNHADDGCNQIRHPGQVVVCSKARTVMSSLRANSPIAFTW